MCVWCVFGVCVCGVCLVCVCVVYVPSQRLLHHNHPAPSDVGLVGNASLLELFQPPSRSRYTRTGRSRRSAHVPDYRAIATRRCGQSVGTTIHHRLTRGAWLSTPA